MNRNIVKNSRMSCNVDTDKGYTIEEMVNRLMDENTPIEETAPIIYTNRKDGVLPEYDIRTDRWDLAQKAMNKVAQDITAKRVKKLYPEKQDEGNGDNSKVE